MGKKSFLHQTLVAGTVSGLLMDMVIVQASRMQTGRSAPGLNAVSHILWGRRAARQNNWSVRYTVSGILLNQLACLFWSGCMEALWPARRMRQSRQGVPRAMFIALIAYIVDYHVIPKRCTPGFELLFPRAWYPSLYAGLAASLWAGACSREFRD
jgi:hypothetical protein